MPTLHRFTDRDGYYIRGLSKGQAMALELTPEGVLYMTETLGLADGGKFAGDTLKWLYKKKWALAMATPPPEVPVVVSQATAAVSDPNPVVYAGVIQVRLTAPEQVPLDQSAEDVVRKLGESGALVAGPIPLPVHLEPYKVIREGGTKTYLIRMYQRVIQVRAPRRQTNEVMRAFDLPRTVDVRVEMLG